MTHLAQQLLTVPPVPGIYMYKNQAGEIVYVGKAKNLRHRVQSYFRASAALDQAKRHMVTQVKTLETIATDTEHEALVLEANLIQKHQPPYNVILRDDKYYLFIKITKEEFPRVLLVRRVQHDHAKYFGPYSSARAVRETLRLLERLFPHRGAQKKDPLILPHPLFSATTSPQYEIDKATYQENIRHIISFLQGEREAIIKTLRAGMEKASQTRAFEQAAVFRDQLRAIVRLDDQQKMYVPHDISLDAVSVASEGGRSAMNVFAIRHGKLVSKNNFVLKHRTGTSPSDIIRQFILQYYSIAQDIPRTILVPVALEDHEVIARWIRSQNPPQFIVPQRGYKKELVRLGESNARLHLSEHETASQTSTRIHQALDQIAAALKLDRSRVDRIETYDISNIQGTLATGSMVVFEKGTAQPRQYKKFRIRLTSTPNDFAMLQEMLRRRFSGRHHDWPAPGLILIDGGKGQLSAVQKIMREQNIHIPIAAIAKNHEELFLPNQSASIRLPYDSAGLFLIQRMRDAAHRFTLSYHRTLRRHAGQRSVLDEIPGIGPKTKRQLLHQFGSIKAIREASDAELFKAIGAKAHLLRQYL